MKKRSIGLFLLVVSLGLGTASSAWGVRIKDIASIEGVRSNQLIGYGLVVGLNGTGDKKDTEFTTQTLMSMLERLGINMNSKDIKVKNVAAVMVTADLPAFAKPGSRIDGLVSSLGDSTSLQGGTLLFTLLRGVDRNVYASAQGPLLVGGFAVSGAAGGGVQKNLPTVGRLVGGVIIEKEVSSQFNEKESLQISLHHPDFTTSDRLARILEGVVGKGQAQALDASTVRLRVPDHFKGQIVNLIATLENQEIQIETVAKVVLDERNGTVVMGENVRISTVAISQGNLSIQIKEESKVSQPLPFSEGKTVVTPESKVKVEEGKGQLHLVRAGVSIGDVVRALNAIGVTPRDLITIFQALKAAGAIQATLEII